MKYFKVNKMSSECWTTKIIRMGWSKPLHLKNTTTKNHIKINTMVSFKTSINNLRRLVILVPPLNSLTINLFKINSFNNFRFLKSLQPRKASNSKIHLTFNIWIDFQIPVVTVNFNQIFNKALQILIIIKTFKIIRSSTASRIF